MDTNPYAWWAVTRKALCGNVLVAAPFFDRSEAVQYMNHHALQTLGCRVTEYNGVCSRSFRSLVESGAIPQLEK